MNQLKRVAVLLAFVLAGFSTGAHAWEFWRSERTSESTAIEVAAQYLGLHQDKDRNILKELLDIDPRRIPWCAAFVNKILEITGVQGSDSLMARSFLTVGTRVKTPQKGDIVVLTRGKDPASGHVGFYMGEADGHVIVLGGNQQKSVNISHYPKYRVLGYRRIAPDRTVAAAEPERRPECHPGSPRYIWTANRCSG